MILSQLSSSSRVWIFQSDRLLNDDQERELSAALSNFVSSWKAHGVDLQADAEILHSSIVVIGVDESKEPPSGCSIDKAFGLLKQFGETEGLDFFNRLKLNISYCNSAKIVTQSEIQELLNQGSLSSQALVFNSWVNTVGELRDNTYIPLKETWVAPKLSFA